MRALRTRVSLVLSFSLFIILSICLLVYLFLSLFRQMCPYSSLLFSASSSNVSRMCCCDCGVYGHRHCLGRKYIKKCLIYRRAIAFLSLLGSSQALSPLLLSSVNLYNMAHVSQAVRCDTIPFAQPTVPSNHVQPPSFPFPPPSNEDPILFLSGCCTRF